MRTTLALLVLSLSACGTEGRPAVVLGTLDASVKPDQAIVFSPEDLATDDPDLADTEIINNDGGGITNPCVARASLIYTIDQNNTLASFAPKTLTFTDIGKLNCPAQNFATPFSMGVDASATAWVLYSSGEIFLVDTRNAKCAASLYQPNQNGFLEFGMGFVADAPGAFTEHLYIAGLSNRELGVLDPKRAKPVPMGIGALGGNPELTGNGKAELWGFFPDNQSPRVAQLDKMTAKEGKTFPMPDLAGNPSAWAFAYWGGDFWIFLKKDNNPSTHVYHLVSATGKVTDVVPNSNRTIVGAGVSICAPTIPTH